jgi:chromosome segregation ATPase
MNAPDHDDLDAQLAELEAEERELSAQRSKLHDRLASFPNELTAEKERELSRQRAELHVRIDALRAERSKRRVEQHPDDAS